MIANRKVLTDDMIARIEALASRYPTKQALTLPALHVVHDELRHVPLDAVVEIAQLLGLAPAEVQDTLTFLSILLPGQAAWAGSGICLSLNLLCTSRWRAGA